MLSLLLSFPVIPAFIIASIITISIYMIDTADPENYIDKMYYLKVFIISFITSNTVIYFYKGSSNNVTESINKSISNVKKNVEKVDYTKLTKDVSDSIQTGGENIPEIVANLPDF